MKKFIEEKIAVKCETKEELKKFLERCEKEGLKWVSKTKAIEFVPSCNPTYMTYGFNLESGLEYGRTCSHLEEEGWKVVTYKEYFDTQKYKYKVGDIVETEFGKGEIKEIEEGNVVPYLVYHYDWDRGHNNFNQYTGGHCWWFKEEEIKLAEQITITRHGHKVVAKYGDKVGVAKCNPEDEFNFEVGAKLALERLFETPSTYKEVERRAEVGEYIKIKWPWGAGGDYKMGDIFKVKNLAGDYGVHVFEHDRYISNLEYVVLEGYKPTDTEPFKPYLKANSKHYGYIGEETNLTAMFGEKLYVGDVVEIFDTDDNTNHGNRMVAKEKDENLYFVMGLYGRMFKNGISGPWQIKKVKSYKDLKHDETLGGIRVVLKDEK